MVGIECIDYYCSMRDTVLTVMTIVLLPRDLQSNWVKGIQITHVVPYE